MGFSRQEYWSGLPCPPPGDLSIPRIKPRSPALWTDPLPAEPPGSLWTLEWVAHPFSRGSSQTRNWTRVSGIAGRFLTSWATREALSSEPMGSCQKELSHLCWIPSVCWVTGTQRKGRKWCTPETQRLPGYDDFGHSAALWLLYGCLYSCPSQTSDRWPAVMRGGRERHAEHRTRRSADQGRASP